jgi:2-haloacid dehalogenase
VSERITAVVFDIHGVLLDWNPRYLYRKLFADKAEMERFLAEICTLEWHSRHDRGVDMRRSCADLAARHPEYASLIEAWVQRSEEMVAGEIPGTVEILDDLRDAGVPRYALTNVEAETYPQRLRRFGFLRSFDGVVASAFEGVAKPDPEIFRRLLDRYRLDPATTLMIDDAPENLASAAGLGMRTFRFESAPRLRRFLEGEGLIGGEAPEPHRRGLTHS